MTHLGMPLSESNTSVSDPVTAFGDLRITELHPLFQGSFEYTVDNTDLNINTLVNGGTIIQVSGMANLATSTTTASSTLFESKQHAKYRPGLGGLLRFTALFTTGVAGTEQYVGIMDESGSSAAFKNGYAIGYNGSDLSILRWRNDILVESIERSDWDDPLNGLGKSGITIIPTNLNVFAINYQYLGAGNMFFCIENPETGRYVFFHMIKYANINLEPSTYNPNFRYMMWVANKATIENIVLKSSSYAYFVEGKTKFIELHQPQNSSGLKEKTSVDTEVAILTIRNKATYASKTNFIDILLQNVTASIEASSANNLGRVRLVRNATLGGSPSYADISTTNSVAEIDTAGTTVSGGKELASVPLAGKNDRIIGNLTSYDMILNPGESVTVAGLSANSATIDASLLWEELF